MRLKSLLALIPLTLLFIFFQNCSAPNSGDLIEFVSHPSFDCKEGADCSDEIERINRYCFFNGLAVLPNTGIKPTAAQSPRIVNLKQDFAPTEIFQALFYTKVVKALRGVKTQIQKVVNLMDMKWLMKSLCWPI